MHNIKLQINNLMRYVGREIKGRNELYDSEGKRCWDKVSSHMGGRRTSKQFSQRWTNWLQYADLPIRTWTENEV